MCRTGPSVPAAESLQKKGTKPVADNTFQLLKGRNQKTPDLGIFMSRAKIVMFDFEKVY